MRFFISRLIISLLIILPVFLKHSNATAQPVKRMNVVFILSDDQRYNTIHALGNPQIITPNLDRLVHSGVAFTRAHIMGGRQGAICAPSRAMIMTGTYANHLTQDGTVIPEQTKTFPELLRANGYTTFATGKWHSDKASYNRSFSTGENIFFGGMHAEDAGGHEHPQLFHYDSSGKYPDSAKWKGEHFSSELYAGAAVDFLNKQNNSSQPFVCYVAFTSPHDPRTPPKKFADMYKADTIALPASYLPEHPFNNGEMQVRDEELLPKPHSKESIKEELAKYYAMITEMDSHVGEILDAIERNGLKENTLIIFAGDNGLAVGNHGLLGKQNLYDHSVRVPLVVAGPGIPHNERNDALCYSQDICPTILDYLDAPKLATAETKSLKPLIDGHVKLLRKEVYFLYRDFQRGIRTADNWKLILYHVNGKDTAQLFNLNNDPAEMHNLSDNKKYQNKRIELRNLLIADMKAYGDNLDITKEDWGVMKKN